MGFFEDELFTSVVRRVSSRWGFSLDPFTLLELATMVKGMTCRGDVGGYELESAAGILAPVLRKHGYRDAEETARRLVLEILREYNASKCPTR